MALAGRLTLVGFPFSFRPPRFLRPLGSFRSSFYWAGRTETKPPSAHPLHSEGEAVSECECCTSLRKNNNLLTSFLSHTTLCSRVFLFNQIIIACPFLLPVSQIPILPMLTVFIFGANHIRCLSSVQNHSSPSSLWFLCIYI